MQLYYTEDDSSPTEGSTNVFVEGQLPTVCLCDLTGGGCDINCECDPDCVIDQTTLQTNSTTYGFDYDNNKVGIEVNCYIKSGILQSVNQKFGMQIVNETDQSICVKVTNLTVTKEIIQIYSRAAASSIANTS